jgi:hypothetical protein
MNESPETEEVVVLSNVCGTLVSPVLLVGETMELVCLRPEAVHSEGQSRRAYFGF